MAGNTAPGVSTVVAREATQNVDPRLTAMFLKPEGSVGIESTYTYILEPIRAPTDSDQEFIFEFPNTGSAYIDLKSTELYIRGALKHRNGTVLGKKEEVVISNNFLHSLF